MTQCSDCGFHMRYATNVSFCPSCGADSMRDIED